MSKYCHDDSIHYCIIGCDECPAYYDDKEYDNYLITEKDQRDFAEAKIRADAIRKFAEWLTNDSAYIEIDYGKFGCPSDSSWESEWKTIDEVLEEYEKEVGV